MPVGRAVFDPIYQDLRRRQIVTGDVEIRTDDLWWLPVDEMMSDVVLQALDRMFRQFKRGIRTAEELVDGVLGELASERRYDLVESATRRLLREVPEAAVAGFVAWHHQRSTSPHRLMIYADSRAVYNHFDASKPVRWEELQTEAGQARVEAYRQELRGNVERVADTVRAVLDEYSRAR